MRNFYRDEFRSINAVNNVAKMVPAAIAVFCSICLAYMWHLNLKDGVHWSAIIGISFAAIRIAMQQRKQKELGFVDTYIVFLLPHLVAVFVLLFWAV